MQSRYYDPEIRRFINADSYVDTGDTVLSTNMFAYCENNPVNNVDENGCSTRSIILNIASMVLSYASLFIENFCPVVKFIVIAAGVYVGIRSFMITNRDYNYDIKELKNYYKVGLISRKQYNTYIKEAKFWRNLGYIAAAITVICSVLSVPATLLMKSVAVAVINALGFAKGMVISRALLIHDLVGSYYHNYKASYDKIIHKRKR